MLQEIQEIIKKNLPAEVGDIIKQELDNGKAAKDRVKLLELEISSYRENVLNLQNDINVLRGKEIQIETLIERENLVMEKENSLAVDNAKLLVKAAEDRATLAKEFVALVFHSPVYCESRSKTVPVVVPGSNGSQGYVSSATETETKITEKK